MLILCELIIIYVYPPAESEIRR